MWLLNTILVGYMTFWHHRVVCNKHFININKHSPAVDVYFIIDIWERHWWSPGVSLSSSVSEYSFSSHSQLGRIRAFDWLWSEVLSIKERERDLFSKLAYSCSVCSPKLWRELAVLSHVFPWELLMGFWRSSFLFLWVK